MGLIMVHYRFYGMVGTMIINAQDVSCDDDEDAGRRARELLDENGATYDAFEAWQGARLVCRHERAPALGTASSAASRPPPGRH
jgi:hypothetical protein